MARIKIKYNVKDFERIRKDPRVVEDLKRRTQAIADACNAESSWGGYYGAVTVEGDRPRGRVWSIARAAEDNARNQRLIRNLDAAR